MNSTLLGDALRYGFVHEMTEDNEDEEYKYICASVLYMYFFGLIKKDTLQLFKKMINENWFRKTIDEKESIMKLSEELMNDLKQHYTFSKFDHLIKLLNQMNIPKWLHNHSTEIMTLENVELIGEELYFIMGKNTANRGVLSMVHTKDIEYIDECTLESREAIHIIGTVYGKIMGVDKNEKKIYLTLVNENKVFVEYNCCTHQFTVIHMKLLGMMGDVPIVIDAKEMLSARLGEELCVLQEYSDTKEYYLGEKSKILVVPKKDSIEFFKPYYLTLDGKQKECQGKFTKRFVWKTITENLINDAFSDHETLLECEIMGNIIPEVLTILQIRAIFNNMFSETFQVTNEQYLLFDSILDNLSQYIDNEVYITSILYALCKCDKCLRKATEHKFPSRELFWAIKK